MKRCEVCDISSDSWCNNNHPTSVFYPTKQAYDAYLRSLTFRVEKDGKTVCSECSYVVNRTRREREDI
jgi:hypothetical protein